MTIGTSPSLLILINADLTQSIQDTFTRQFYLSEIITKAEFDSRVAANPNYPSFVHTNNLRVMVMSSLRDMTNRDLFDLVLFAKAGLVSVEVNKRGPHGITLPIDRAYLSMLIFLNNPPNNFTTERPDIDDGFVGQDDNDDFDPTHLDPAPRNVEPVKL